MSILCYDDKVMTLANVNKNEARTYADLAEITTSDPGFRAADSAPFPTDMPPAGTVYAHNAARGEAKQLLFETLADNPTPSLDADGHLTPETQWELTRRATLRELGGVTLGAFGDYFTNLQGRQAAINHETNDLPDGEPAVIATNGRIVSANRNYDAPVEFFDIALGVIERAKRSDRHAVGPENYATALKFFSDKYVNLEEPLDEVSSKDIPALVDECLKGFVDVSRRDEPNFVEMTNIYAAIRGLPKGSVDAKYTKPLLEQTMKLLPDYSTRTIMTLLGAIVKLDTVEYGEPTAQLVNLSLRKVDQFETTNNMRTALRAIATLPKTDAAHQAFQAFMARRNDLEMALDISGADDTLYHLKTIADNVIDDQMTHSDIQTLAERIARHAVNTYNRALAVGSVTTDQLRQDKATLSRIMNNYRSI